MLLDAEDEDLGGALGAGELALACCGREHSRGLCTQLLGLQDLPHDRGVARLGRLRGLRLLPGCGRAGVDGAAYCPAQGRVDQGVPTSCAAGASAARA